MPRVRRAVQAKGKNYEGTYDVPLTITVSMSDWSDDEYEVCVVLPTPDGETPLLDYVFDKEEVKALIDPEARRAIKLARIEKLKEQLRKAEEEL